MIRVVQIFLADHLEGVGDGLRDFPTGEVTVSAVADELTDQNIMPVVPARFGIGLEPSLQSVRRSQRKLPKGSVLAIAR